MKVICWCLFSATNKQEKETDESKLNIDSRLLELSEKPRRGRGVGGTPERQGGVGLEALLNISLKEMTEGPIQESHGISGSNFWKLDTLCFLPV